MLIAFNKIKVDPSINSRKHYDDAYIESLATSIKEVGLLEPMIVAEIPGNDGEYPLLAGFCRQLALKSLRWGSKEIEVTVKKVKSNAEADLINLTENTLRKDLHSRDLAARLRLMETGNRVTGREPLERKEIAIKTGLSQSHIGNLIRLDSRLAPKILGDWIKNDLPIAWLLGIAKHNHEDQLKAYVKYLQKEVNKKDREKAQKAGGDGEGDGEGGDGEGEEEVTSGPSKSEIKAQFARLTEKAKDLEEGEDLVICKTKIHVLKWILGGCARV